jgi:hypothetical protein
MSILTLALDEQTLEAGRSYAERHQITLEALVRELLVRVAKSGREATVTEMFRLMDAHPGNSGGSRCGREELYLR